MPAPPRIYTTEGIVIRQIPYGESDRILTIATPHMGKLSVIAKGARKITSKLAGCSDLLTRSTLLIAVGRNLDILTQCEVIERFDALRASLWHATAGFAIAELLQRTMEEHSAHTIVYALSLDAMRRLQNDAESWLIDPSAQSGAGPAGRGWVIARYYEMRLLDVLGYQPSLQECVVCAAQLQPVEDNGFSIELGGVVCPSCQRFSARPLPLLAFKVLRYIQRTDWQDMPVLRLDADTRSVVEAIVQGSLNHYLERPVRAWNMTAPELPKPETP